MSKRRDVPNWAEPRPLPVFEIPRGKRLSSYQLAIRADLERPSEREDALDDLDSLIRVFDDASDLATQHLTHCATALQTLRRVRRELTR